MKRKMLMFGGVSELRHEQDRRRVFLTMTVSGSGDEYCFEMSPENALKLAGNLIVCAGEDKGKLSECVGGARKSWEVRHVE